MARPERNWSEGGKGKAGENTSTVAILGSPVEPPELRKLQVMQKSLESDFRGF